jgi:DUF2946 family protein
MRARLQKFLPIVLIALAMQVLAPIAACWAAGLAVADPLQDAVVCHSAGAAADDQTGAPGAQGAACALCSLAQANTSPDPPQATFATPVCLAERVVWRGADAAIVTSHGGSNAQARAPPHAT